MAIQDIILPAMGEGITEATIIKWLKQEGETIEEDESIVEIATDKVDSEVPSPFSGKIAKLIVNEGDIAKIGDTIAVISSDGNMNVDIEEIQTKKVEIEPNIKQTQHIQNKSEQQKIQSDINMQNTDQFLSPLVRSIIKKESISEDEIINIQGTGLNNRITKSDIFNYIESRNQTINIDVNPKIEIETETDNKFEKASYLNEEGIEVIQMDRVRKLIADHMVNSKRTSPHVTSFIEADVTEIVKWREQNKDAFFNRYNTKLTLTHIFTEATVDAIKDYPMINVSVDESNIIKKKFINIGMATALPNGNLIVPVIKKACQQNITGLAKTTNDLVDKARNNKLLPDDIKGGTFTITNFGTFGNIAGTPIINQPEVAILGLGAIQKKPVVKETEAGDAIVVRKIMMLSLSYDHRIVDGALGGMFLKRIKENLEAFDFSRKI
jgi:2-oxoglutarate dehydrogenase E2 component (dihydrolipoamide succinyltransferase)